MTYPQPPGDKGAFQLGIINITTALVADMVVFNSKMHKDAFLNAVPEFLKRGSDYKPKGITDKIREKAEVLYPGITLPFDRDIDIDAEKQTNPPLIVWNHRWGFDKNCEMFFSVLEEIDNMGLDFNLALMGENFGKIPEEFKEAEKKFKERILQFFLRTGTVPIATLMRRLLTGYAASFNRRHRRHGHVFQNRYKSILCQEDPYLLDLSPVWAC